MASETFDDSWISIAPVGGRVSPALDAGVLKALRRARLCRGIENEQLEIVAVCARRMVYAAGEAICTHGDRAEYLYVVVRGRVQLALHGVDSEYRLLDYVGAGDHFGEMPLLTDARCAATALALTDCELLLIAREEFQRLLTTIPQFGANVSRSLGFQLRGQTSGRRRRWQPKHIGVVHSTLQTQGVLRLVAEGLRARDESVAVLTQRPVRPESDGDYAVERIETGSLEQLQAVSQRIVRLSEANERVILDLRQEPGMGVELSLLARLLLECEMVLWLAEPRFREAAVRSLRALLACEPRLAPRVHWVWTLNAEERFAPLLPELGIAPRDFKLAVEDQSPDKILQRQGVTSLVRHLSGVHVGLALGGGGARGLAHLGVLKAFDEAGIFFDSIAGTSCGALMGAAYAAGWQPTEATRRFANDLTPGRFWRWLPRHKHWYLFAMFHLGAWDGMLRRYLEDYQLQQLPVSLSTVAVDLISGREVIRDRGDIVHAVLESINLPMISRPILRDGMVLVDGSVLNKLPGDVLARRGANLVIGVDVSARVAPRFAENQAGMATPQMRRPGPIETLLRVHEVQDSGLVALRGSAIDLVIAPETADFEFADFTKAHELAERGYRAASEALPQVRQLLADLESA